MFRNIPFTQAFHNTFHYAELALTILVVDVPMIALYNILRIKYKLESKILDKNITGLNQWIGKSGRDKIDYLNEELKLVDVSLSLEIPSTIEHSELHENGLLLSDSMLMELPKKANTEVSISSQNIDYRVIIDANHFIYILLNKPFSNGNSANVTLAQRVLVKENQFLNGGWVVAKEEFETQPTKIADECMMLHMMKNLVGISILKNNKIVSFQKFISGYRPDFNYNGCTLKRTLDFCINMLGEIRNLHNTYKITHHDLKPGNMIHHYNNNSVELIDFGTASPVTESALSSYNKKIDEFEARYCIQHFLSNLWTETEENKKLSKLIIQRLDECITPALAFETNAIIDWLKDIKRALDHSLPSNEIEKIIKRTNLGFSTFALSNLSTSLFYNRPRSSPYLIEGNGLSMTENTLKRQ